jgi:hypothetical protein
MSALNLENLPKNAAGLKLFKHDAQDNLRSCETVIFKNGRSAVEIVLRRASIAGRVQIEPFDGPMDYFADVFLDDGCSDVSVLLDRKSYAALKNKWMRCNLETTP